MPTAWLPWPGNMKAVVMQAHASSSGPIHTEPPWRVKPPDGKVDVVFGTAEAGGIAERGKECA